MGILAGQLGEDERLGDEASQMGPIQRRVGMRQLQPSARRSFFSHFNQNPGPSWTDPLRRFLLQKSYDVAQGDPEPGAQSEQGVVSGLNIAQLAALNQVASTSGPFNPNAGGPGIQTPPFVQPITPAPNAGSAWSPGPGFLEELLRQGITSRASY